MKTMKTILRKSLGYTVIMALCLVVTLLVAGSCEGQETSSKVCNVENPLTDLPWLKEIIDGFERDTEVGYKQHARIYQCTYKDGIGFLIVPCVGCPDMGYTFTNCEGQTLCILWGLAGDPCTEYEIDLESKKIIYEINN